MAKAAKGRRDLGNRRGCVVLRERGRNRTFDRLNRKTRDRKRDVKKESKYDA